MASTKLTRNHSGAPTSRKKMTWSWWIKRSKLGATQYLYNQYRSADSYNSGVLFQSDDSIRFWDYGAASNDIDLQTTRLFRDVNAWYHIVLAIDTTQGTASNRVKLYVNGVQETAFDVSTYPSQDHQLRMGEAGSAYQQQIGFQGFGSTYQSYFDGVMSHVHYVDGSALAPTVFGSTDATTGEWKINTNPSYTVGNNGFFILKDGNSVTDSSSNSNAFTVSAGTLTKTEDCPSNVFCIMNPLMNYSNGAPTFFHANTRIDGSGSAWLRTCGSLGARTGKFYYEAKIVTYYGDGRPIRIGWDSIDFPRKGADTYYSGFNISSDGYIRGGIKGYNNYDPNATSLGGSFTGGDFLGFAIDLDNDLITCYKNGTVFNNVNGLDISSNSNCSIKNSLGHLVSPSCNWYAVNDNDNVIDFNFGNGAFGSTQLTGTTYNDSQGNGIFKYQPPANYLAWCTKNFNV
jgi:hypothetical protein